MITALKFVSDFTSYVISKFRWRSKKKPLELAQEQIKQITNDLYLYSEDFKNVFNQNVSIQINLENFYTSLKDNNVTKIRWRWQTSRKETIQFFISILLGSALTLLSLNMMPFFMAYTAVGLNVLHLYSWAKSQLLLAFCGFVRQSFYIVSNFSFPFNLFTLVNKINASKMPAYEKNSSYLGLLLFLIIAWSASMAYGNLAELLTKNGFKTAPAVFKFLEHFGLVGTLNKLNDTGVYHLIVQSVTGTGIHNGISQDRIREMENMQSDAEKYANSLPAVMIEQLETRNTTNITPDDIKNIIQLRKNWANKSKSLLDDDDLEEDETSSQMSDYASLSKNESGYSSLPVNSSFISSSPSECNRRSMPTS